MRIALVSLHTSPGAVPGRADAGGMNVVVAEAAHALAARGHEVSVITRASDDAAAGERPLDPARPGPSLVAIEAGDPGLRKEELPTILPAASRALAALGPFDAVHAHYWLSGVAARETAARSSVGLALSLHTVGAQKNARLAANDRGEPPLRIAAERALIRESTLVAGSEGELAAARSAAGGSAGRGIVIHPGVDTSAFTPRDVSRETERLGDRRPFRIVVLGRVQPLKGQDLAIRAIGALMKLDPELAARTELLIAGEPTPGGEAWAAGLPHLAEELGATDHVRFLPAQGRSEAARLLATADLALVPSRSETFGLVAVEAAACGVPTIAGRHTGLLESAPDGRSAILVDGRDPADWARAIHGLLRDPARRSALGASARAFALTLDWARHAERLEALYRELARR
ncbi:glycosyltransferase [Leucobacter sp. CSA2]|uniref:Glycosyltransferase n=1 Tax=Leucobacter edaphi TaxID=2796472 RepID=A0A934UWR8_9MICO|nr:glycosyltransferase [Leucobacter edaphi]MBK0421969.1 glycosyltransferase [Leucobacter edaphi]